MLVLFPIEAVIFLALVAGTGWYEQHRKQQRSALRFAAHLELLSKSLRACDLCRIPTETKPELLYSNTAMLCPTCQKQYCSDGTIPPDLALAATRHREMVLDELTRPS